MDKTVPTPAARLLLFIGGIEAPRGYDTIFGNNQGKLPKPITTMTVDQVLAAQPGWSRRFGSSAAGKYQVMHETLSGLKKELGLRGTQLFDANLQDRLGYHLLRRRGYDLFVAGKLSRTAFGLRLAQEWASFPVLAPVKGAHRNLVRGQSYYSGDSLNHSLVRAERVEAVLDEVLALARTGPSPAPTPEPTPVPMPAPMPLPDPKSPWSSKTNITAILTPIFVWAALKGLDFPPETREMIVGIMVTVAGAFITFFHSTASQAVAGSPLAREIRNAQQEQDQSAIAADVAQANPPAAVEPDVSGPVPIDLSTAPLEDVVEQLPAFVARLQRVARVAQVLQGAAAFRNGPGTER